MPTANFDMTDFNRKLNNTIQYSMGFTKGIELNRLRFNQTLGEYTVQALGKYIDAKARGNPNALHHVYEPGMVGQEKARLFNFDAVATIENIIISGRFLPSSGTPTNGGEPFIDKARIMEDQISIVITPRSSNVLAFEYEGQTVFTSNSIYIDHPGGDEVAGSFGRVIDEFFLNYFTNAMLQPLIADLEKADEYLVNFNAGVNGGGRSLGIRAGKAYLSMTGVIE